MKCSTRPTFSTYISGHDSLCQPNWKFNPSSDSSCFLQTNFGKEYVLFADDIQSLADRLYLAKDAKVIGAGYWTVGDELPGFFEMIQGIFS